VVALRLPGAEVKEISGQEIGTHGILSKLKAKLGLEKEVDGWLITTNSNHPLLQQADRFVTLAMNGLCSVTGATISKSDIAISASVPITAFNGRDRLPASQGQPATPQA